jgi:CDP-glycerol glycerophosphotransferase
VVLYAPTYRDRLTTRTFAARRFDELDLDVLARTLGDGFTILVRGHNNNQRELDRVTGVARVVDVTDYPEINDLTLAADVAVLDYSSLRFDWAITGKPMVFFVPDLEEYFALREPLFPFEGTAPGPWATTTAEVAAALADLDVVRTRYAADIAAFNARFNALNDGHASERVYDAFFGGDR